MASDEWRWADPKGQQRLLRTDELRTALAGGILAPNVPVWRRGMATWKPAEEVPELMESAIGQNGGATSKLAPPPAFVVAAQTDLESAAEQGPEEPPPPPKYVPATTVKKPTAKPPPVPAASAKPPPVPAASAKPPPVASGKPPPVASAKPPPVASAKPPAVSPVAVSAKPPPPVPKKESVRPESIDAGWGDDPSKRSDLPPAPVPPLQQGASLPTFIGVPALPTIARHQTLPVSPAPPPIPQAPPPTYQAPRSPPPPAPGIQKHATLIGLENPMLPDADSPPPPSVSAPIVAPGPSVSASPPGAVTQPPPWEGTAEVHMPKIPASGVPKITPPVEELSGSVLLTEDSQAGPLPKQREVELSSSDLLERESAVSVVKAPPLGVGAKASTLLGLSPTAPLPLVREIHREPAGAASAGDEKVASAPPPRLPTPKPPEPEPTHVTPKPIVDLAVLRAKAEAAYKDLLEGPKPRLYAVAGAAGFFVIVLFALVIKAVFGGSTDDSTTTTTTTPNASGSASGSAPTTLPTNKNIPPVVTAKLSSCSVSGEAHVVSPHALVQAGVEVVTVGNAVALGFASGPKEATFATLDPATITATTTNQKTSANAIRRVTPTAADAAAIDADNKGDALHGRRAIAKWDVGANGSELQWAPRGGATGTKLWAMDSDAAVEALRGVATSDGIAVTYRQSNAIFVGAAKGERLDAYGAPNRVPSMGPQIGSPAIAYADGVVFVAWADRASTADPWGVRLLSWHLGEPAPAARAFKLPGGGLGEHAMSPGVAALPGGKFLLVWTEGATGSHQVRAQVLDPEGAASGSPMTISGDGVNAGQGQAAVLPDGRGLVAFLAGSGKTFDVRATPIKCQ